MDLSQNTDVRLLLSCLKNDPTFQLSMTDRNKLKKKIKTAQLPLQPPIQPSIQPSIQSSFQPNEEIVIDSDEKKNSIESSSYNHSSYNSDKYEINVMLNELKKLREEVEKSRQIPSLGSVGQIAALIKWDVRFDAG